MAPYIPIDYTGHRESEFFKRKSGDTMGKSRKVSKGLSSRFVPDYRHAVETVADSDGLGSSGRVDPEFIAMQESSGRGRQYYSLNAEGIDGSAVPFQVFSLSKMSLLDKKELEVRLVGELERVRKLQTKISSFNTDAMMWPHQGDGHTYQDERMRLLHPEGVQHKDLPMSAGKRKLPSEKNGVRTKGGAVLATRNDSVKNGLPPSANFDVLMKQCGTLLSRLWGHRLSWIFQKPVDIVEHKIPDYFNIIKHPMDLGTVKEKLRSKQYTNPLEFAADVRLTFNNAMTYNPVGHLVHTMADTLSKIFESGWKAIEKKIPFIVDDSVTSNMEFNMEHGIAYPPSKKPRLSPPETNKNAMSDAEKQTLSSELDALLEELPENIIIFLKESTVSISQVTDDEIEIDFDSLSDGILFTLRKLLDDYLLEKQKRQLKSEQPKTEMKNEFEHQVNIDDEPAEEEVDIVGNDQPPLSSSPPAKDHEDNAQRGGLSTSQNSICKSASSSSDSQSSSGEQDGVQSSIPATVSNETLNVKVQNSETDNVYTSRDLLNGHSEKHSLSSTSVEHNCHQDGENAPSKRQVSPERLYRAALLRGRFADIIIKAQEKNSEKGDCPDPEKLKLERDELERRRREEKARLQAEAKGAEEARRKAQLEAEAEAKRKRELEREAARHALQQMEKTVVINEGSQFIEDFEMLSSAVAEFTADFESKDPESEKDPLGSFKFQGNSNPLEQLGLYMKNEDDEEEEAGPRSMLYAANDPEERETEPQIAPYTTDDLEEGEAEPRSAPCTANDPEEGEAEPQSTQETPNNPKEGEGEAEPCSTPDTANDPEDGETKPPSASLETTRINPEEGEAEPRSTLDTTANDSEEDETALLDITANDLQEECETEPPIASLDVTGNDPEEGETEPHSTLDTTANDPQGKCETKPPSASLDITGNRPEEGEAKPQSALDITENDPEGETEPPTTLETPRI